MSELRAAIEQYLTLRRSLGFKLDMAARLLGQFADYCEKASASRVSIDVAVAWATAPAGASPWLVGSAARSRARLRRLGADPGLGH